MSRGMSRYVKRDVRVEGRLIYSSPWLSAMGRNSGETESWQIGRSTLHVGKFNKGDDATNPSAVGNW